MNKMDQVINEMDLLRVLATGALVMNPEQASLQKALGILGLDFIKNGWILFRTGKENYPGPGVLAHNEHYQKLDKPLDLLGYFAAQHLIAAGRILDPNEHQLLQCVLYWRAIGVAMQVLTGSRVWLFPFVDLFKEWFILFLLDAPKWTFGLATLFKFWVEYKFHITKEGRAGLTNANLHLRL